MTQKIVGHNIYDFDLRYLTHWSAFNGAKGSQFLQPVNGRYWPNVYYDLMAWHNAGKYGASYISLSDLAVCFGLEPKEENGKHFYLWDQDKKEEYLAHDLYLTDGIFKQVNETFNIADEWMVFDIETAPRPIEKLQKIVKPFDRDNVTVPKTYKKQEAIDNYIDKAEAEYWPNILDKAALHAKHSDPVAIGYRYSDGRVEMDFDEPVALCNRFWERCSEVLHNELKEKNKI